MFTYNIFRSSHNISTKKNSSKYEVQEYEAVDMGIPRNRVTLETSQPPDKEEEIDTINCIAYGEIKNPSYCENKEETQHDVVTGVYETVQ